MRDVFQQELREVQNRLVDISELVQIAITQASSAFQTANVEMAEQVIAQDSLIDEMATSLDELAIDILVRQQPVASDLRLMVSALRISASLERMGDIAEHIALLARYRFPEPVVPDSLENTFQKMGAYDVEISQALTNLLRTQDLKYVEKIRQTDDQIDALHAGVFGQVLSKSFEGGRVGVVDATLASRYHERFGDHAVSITKKVLYLVSGEYA